MIRTFIATKIPPTPGLRSLHQALSELGERFEPQTLGKLHVTLKFLGDTSKSQVPEICSLVKAVVERHPAMHINLAGLGAFPHAQRPSVVWVGLDQAESLSRIAADLDRELIALGFVPEGRPFHPHLTLLRVKSRPPEALLALLSDEADTKFGAVAIETVELMQSEMTRSGSRYTTLATFRLAIQD
jgi:2'-5' RNA ligase